MASVVSTTKLAWQRLFSRPLGFISKKPLDYSRPLTHKYQYDYAMLVKIYGAAPEGGEVRYSPAQCMGAKKAVIMGKPDFAHTSTSFVERQNLTMRMSMRRFTRLTNGFSKKVENHEHSVALHFMHYNFCRIHKTLRVTPAMEAGVVDHVFELSELIEILDRYSN